jgi:N-methylhydantoinase A
MREVIVPPSPGATSALGLLFVDNLHDLMRAYSAPATEVDVTTVTALYDEMESEIAELLSADGFAADQIEFVRYVELRYAGQVRALRVPMPARAITADTMQAAVSTFHSDYESEFKYAMTDAPVETKTLRLVGAGRTTKPALKRETRTGTAEAALRGTRAVYFDGEWFEQTPVYTRTELLPGAVVAGPAIVEQYDTTTVVQPGATVEVDEYLNLLVTPNPAA